MNRLTMNNRLDIAKELLSKDGHCQDCMQNRRDEESDKCYKDCKRYKAIVGINEALKIINKE